MKVTAKVSRYIVDRRKGFTRAGAGLVALLLAVVGIKVATDTGTDKDPDRDLVFLVSTSMDRAQDLFSERFPGYRRINVVLFEDSTATACGLGLTTSGPFFCSGDSTAYIDLTFLRSIRGDLARGYVIAHELGHAVQHALHRDTRRPSIDLELESDCLAAVWARTEQAAGRLDQGDIPSALAEAAAVGDDRLCPRCSSEQWSHGSSDQRIAAFTRGLATGSCW